MLLSTAKTLQQYRSIGNTTSLITLYIPGRTQVSDMNKFVTTELSQASNIKSRITKQGVQDALKGVSTQLKNYKQFPENGVVIVSGNTTEKNVSITIEPPKNVDRFFYHCGNSFCV